MGANTHWARTLRRLYLGTRNFETSNYNEGGLQKAHRKCVLCKAYYTLFQNVSAHNRLLFHFIFHELCVVRHTLLCTSSVVSFILRKELDHTTGPTA